MSEFTKITLNVHDLYELEDLPTWFDVEYEDYLGDDGYTKYDCTCILRRVLLGGLVLEYDSLVKMVGVDELTKVELRYRETLTGE